MCDPRLGGKSTVATGRKLTPGERVELAEKRDQTRDHPGKEVASIVRNVSLSPTNGTREGPGRRRGAKPTSTDHRLPSEPGLNVTSAVPPTAVRLGRSTDRSRTIA